MAKKKERITIEERLRKALVPDWEQPYKVRSNWVWTNIGAISNVFTGNSINAKKKAENYTGLKEGLNYIATKDIGFDNSIDYENGIKISDYGSFKIAPSGTSLLCIEGGSAGRKIGFTAEDVCFGNKLCAFATTVVNSKIIFYYIQSENFSQSFFKEHHGLIGGVSVSLLKSISIPLPPLAEQQRIVDRIESLFSKLDEAKEKAQTALNSFKNRNAAILHKAFTGELTKKWREENGVSLGSWEQVTFGEIIKLGPQNGLYKSQSAYGSGIKIIRIDSFYNGDIEPWNTIKRLQLEESKINLYKLEVGDILVNRVNSMPYLGKSALVRELPETCVFESNIMRLSLDTQKALPEYIISYLNSSIGLEELKKNAKQAVNQASINQQDVKNAVISLPTLLEQTEIVRILDSIFEKEKQAKELASVIEKIGLMKKAILARAFRGELGTNNPEEESALEILKEILSIENEKEKKSVKKSMTIPISITKQFKTDLEEQIYRVILENQNSTLNQILSCISSSKHLDAMEVLTILYEKGIIDKKNDLFFTK